MPATQLANLAISSVAAAPTPATSGTSITVTAGQGSRFPAAGPFPLTVWPASAQPDPTNAEILLCTSRSGDVLTVVRAQEGTTTRSIVVGDQIMSSVTAAVMNEIQTAVNVSLFTTGVGR